LLCYWKLQPQPRGRGGGKSNQPRRLQARAGGGKDWVEQREALPQHLEVPVLTTYPAKVHPPPPA